MSNHQLSQLILYGLGTLLVLFILYCLRWYLFTGLIGLGGYHLYKHLHRPRS